MVLNQTKAVPFTIKKESLDFEKANNLNKILDDEGNETRKKVDRKVVDEIVDKNKTKLNESVITKKTEHYETQIISIVKPKNESTATKTTSTITSATE